MAAGRTFTPAELSGLPPAAWLALSPDDKARYAREAVDYMVARTLTADAAYLAGDHDAVGSYRRFELGE